MCGECVEKLRKEVGEKGLKLSITEKRKEGESVMQISGRKTTGVQSKRWSNSGRKCGKTLGVCLRTQTKELGANENARRKKCNVRFLLIKKIGSSRKESFRGLAWFLRERGEDKRWVLRPQQG